MIKLFKLIVQLLFSKHAVFLNSPLQLMNFIEFSNLKEFIYLKKIPIYIGYANKNNIKRIKKVLRIFKLKLDIVYLNEEIDAYIIHLIIKIRKFFKINYIECTIGDIRYYLHREFFKISQKKNILDDGTSSFSFKHALKDLNSNKTLIFTIFENIKLKNIKIYYNNFLFLKKKFKVSNKYSKKIIHFISSKVHEEIKIPEKIFLLLESLQKKSKKKIIYIPHPKENIEIIKKKINFEIMKIDIPIELFYLTIDKLPSKIIFNYSSSLFNLKKIFNNSKNFQNISLKNKSIFLNKENQFSFTYYDKELKRLNIKYQIF